MEVTKNSKCDVSKYPNFDAHFMQHKSVRPIFYRLKFARVVGSVSLMKKLSYSAKKLSIVCVFISNAAIGICMA